MLQLLIPFDALWDVKGRPKPVDPREPGAHLGIEQRAKDRDAHCGGHAPHQDPGAHARGHVLKGHGGLDDHHGGLDRESDARARDDLDAELCGESRVWVQERGKENVPDTSQAETCPDERTGEVVPRGELASDDGPDRDGHGEGDDGLAGLFGIQTAHLGVSGALCVKSIASIA